MTGQDPIVFCILLRQSLHLSTEQIAHCAADAVQYLLIRYFTLQIVAAKTHEPELTDNQWLKTTTEWLSSHSAKSLVVLPEEEWVRAKSECSESKMLFCLKDRKGTEIALIFRPLHLSELPPHLCHF